MAKQKVVLKLSMEDAKKRSKAMQCAVGMHGVLSVSHEGDKMTVVGEGIDSVALTTLLRKKMGYVELELVAAVEEKKEKKVKVEAEVKSNIQPVILPHDYYGRSVGTFTQPLYYHADVTEPSYDQDSCSIM
ncbi:disease resistance protein Pik-1-like isoform X2 [Dendrobium catenatum]|uniref:disease resistance protein Pik-1-like isoform X1 n=1 Tax=Dendrobium catenatum TaxID=906689 RepID=UPI0009F6F968|nr:disease resistance protein Pik-1-like isoform X1 [Dendrobium catenatum]XP_028552234.1 disease resistance protein Pik-1-like isoform X2 [Dendrobium catenatum]